MKVELQRWQKYSRCPALGRRGKLTAMTETKPNRRWFRFSLRTLFVLVTLFGCWLAYQLNWIRERHNAPVLAGISTAIEATPAGPKEVTIEHDPPWPLAWFGERGYSALAVDESYGEQEIERIRKLFPEADVEPIPSDDILPEYRRQATMPATH